MTIGNPAFYSTLVMSVSKKIKCQTVRTRETVSVSLSDVLYVYIPFAKPNVRLLNSNSEVQRKCNDVVIKFMDEAEVVLEAAYTLFYKQI